MSMKTRERAFEDEITVTLLAAGWVTADPKNTYDRDLALAPSQAIAYIKRTQPKEWEKIVSLHGASSDEVFAKRLAEQLDKHGALHVLRHGFKHVSAAFKMCQFMPAHGLNEDVIQAYNANSVCVMRQIHYSKYSPDDSIDLVLFVNGIPVATAELKTDLQQNIRDAVTQYVEDRPPRDPKTKAIEPLLFGHRRALVHFAVSTDEVRMTTKLDGENTRFLPFNLGNKGGKGNPPNPSGYMTDYLWKRIWQRDAWLDILGRFVHVEGADDAKTDAKVIFPRYHQWEAVTKIVSGAKQEGCGKSYLVQHSAGSGKSNSIAWLAYRLQDLHDATDKKIFDSVIIITDRRVLDRQLGDTIQQFERTKGLVERAENSEQLADALDKGVPIIVTTLQKFPFVAEKVGTLKDRRFALIVDEAHSSQTGEAAKKVREILAKEGLDEETATGEDYVQAVVQAQGPRKNLSYFAFTATPKQKTLELFGRKGSDGKPHPFHLYTMRQAIEEGFILDVLKGYVTYDTLYKIEKTYAENVDVDPAVAKSVIAKFLRLHPYNIAQKIEVIVDHFRTKVIPMLGGRAKAMVVTDSRKAAVRYKLALEKYINEQGYKDVKALVAFSGSVSDPESGPDEFTESNMNPGLAGRSLETAFGHEYNILLVANKFQTGFDQPLLCAMYVDKRLDGVMAVQTLSRLNRIHAGKDKTFVLDFRNDLDGVRKAFEPYYETTALSDVTDPNLVHDLYEKLMGSDVLRKPEIDAFAEAFYGKGPQAGLHAQLNPAALRFLELSTDEQVRFRKDLQSFVRLFDFMSQVIAYGDTDLEKLSSYARFLLRRMEQPNPAADLDILDKIELTHYRLQQNEQRDVTLGEDSIELKPITAVGSAGARTITQEELSKIIEEVNEIFSGDITDADRIHYTEHVIGKLLENQDLKAQAAVNSKEQFEIGGFSEAFIDAVLDARKGHESMSDQVLEDQATRDRFMKLVAQRVYDLFKKQGAPIEILEL